MPDTETREVDPFAAFMAGEDPECLRTVAETRIAPPSAEAARTEEELRALFLKDPRGTEVPATLTIRVNKFERRESEFRYGTFQTVLREIPEPLRRRIETLLKSFPADERVEIQLGAEANAAWHDLAWYLLRKGRYAARRAQKYQECTCIDCESKFPASQPWCINPKCPGAEAYRRITGNAPGTTVTNRGETPRAANADKGGMQPPRRRRTG